MKEYRNIWTVEEKKIEAGQFCKKGKTMCLYGIVREFSEFCSSFFIFNKNKNGPTDDKIKKIVKEPKFYIGTYGD